MNAQILTRSILLAALPFFFAGALTHSLCDAALAQGQPSEEYASSKSLTERIRTNPAAWINRGIGERYRALVPRRSNFTRNSQSLLQSSTWMNSEFHVSMAAKKYGITNDEGNPRTPK